MLLGGLCSRKELFLVNTTIYNAGDFSGLRTSCICNTGDRCVCVSMTSKT